MPCLERPDGVEIHFEERGSGPLVVLVSYWSMHPSVFDPLTKELVGDRRVVRYDDRGTGQSTRTGRYDLDTAAADLEALVEHLGEPAVLVGTADGPARAIRVAVRQPELVPAVVAIGGPPFGRAAFSDSDTLAASEPVVQALLSQVETDYRGGLRTLVTATNPQMSEDEVRQRIADQAEHCPVEAAAPRLHAWASDDRKDDSLAVGNRLWVVVSEAMAGGWFPAGAEMAAVVERVLPEANVVDVEDGMVSRPDLSAAVIRGVTATAAATSGQNAAGA
jgi:pimeloyl-ACP methyl ester carboxylesterase